MASRTRRFFLNAVSLTFTALIMRSVAMIFNVYVSAVAGSEAMGLYSLLGSVYSFAVTLATAGINLGTTRIVSDALGNGDLPLARRSSKKALVYCVIAGGCATLLLFSLAPAIGERLLGDRRVILPLRILSASLLPISVCSCISGYFTAVRRVKANAAFQVASQLTRILVTVALFTLVLRKSAEVACIILVIGSTVSEIFSLFINYLLYRRDLKKLSLEVDVKKTGDTREVTTKLLGITLPVTFSACIRSLFTMLQHILIPKGLRTSGKSWDKALSSYGAVHGMAMPLILFPSAILTAFSGLLIPEVSECIVQSDNERLKRFSYRALTLALIFSFGVSGIMVFYSEELGNVIYKSSETAKYIRILAPLIPVMYVDSTVDAVLKGSGHQVYSMNVNIVDALTSCLLVYFLVPRLGIWGYIIAIYATEILNTTLSILKMISVSTIKPRVFHQLVMPILCIVGATNASKLILAQIPIDVPQAAFLTFGIAFTIALYLIFLFLTSTVGKDEREFLDAALLSEHKYAARQTKYPQA